MKKMPLKKLTQENVEDAVALYDAGRSCSWLGREFGVSRQSMHDLLKRRTTMRTRERYGADNHFYRGGAKAVDAAQNKVEKAVLRGDIVRPETCDACGKTPPRMRDGRSAIQAHHDDYSKPLDVRWLCQPCHHAHHAQAST